ncbi:MAG TPA: thioredoxin family protein [Aromatoleum sp.]|uniref:thioredoxin family protein n=1 Tax=Aromatoleum sp. TaxID=2307007 RepID=UPI002B472693|nr:thioredoxin family protein [Aromatoleum sp.]HJV24348.1 thioredoxin family protein [Aromatoleum sp.]
MTIESTSPRGYAGTQPSRAEIDALDGLAVIDFGTDWCGICRGARPAIEEALAQYPDVRHIRVEDGPGRALGRSFRVKLWPTLIFLRQGREVERVVRPAGAGNVAAALARLEEAA